jgi:CheY-like chemotaxis protein
VLLADLAMPREDGYALIRKVRGLPAERGGAVPAAALTAHASGNDRTRVLAAGYKPVDPGALAAAVARLGRARRAS